MIFLFFACGSVLLWGDDIFVLSSPLVCVCVCVCVHILVSLGRAALALARVGDLLFFSPFSFFA
jgi:hypothetical protein